MSKKITLSADGNSATVADATFSDILTTAVSSDSCVTGTYGYVQKALIIFGGMSLQNKRLGRGWNPISVA